MTTMRADRQILEEHLAIEATVDASRADAATRLAAINNSSWSFLEGTAGAFDEDFNVFPQRVRAYLNSRAGMLVPGQDQATHHYEGCTHSVEARPSSKLKDPIIINISDDEE